MREFAQANIFEPLGMHDTFFNDRVMEVVPGVADAYLPLPDGSILRHNTDLNIVGDGSIFTTIEDFYRWDQNFYENRLGKGGPAFVERMQSPGVLIITSSIIPILEPRRSTIPKEWTWGM